MHRREPFSKLDEWTTDAGTTVKTGETVLAKPKFIDRRLPAVVVAIYWEPLGLPGGKFDHRGETVGEDEDGLPIRENPDQYDCRLAVRVRFEPDSSQFDHMEGKRRKIMEHDLDFVIGTGPEIRRDRSNCLA